MKIALTLLAALAIGAGSLKADLKDVSDTRFGGGSSGPIVVAPAPVPYPGR